MLGCGVLQELVAWLWHHVHYLGQHHGPDPQAYLGWNGASQVRDNAATLQAYHGQGHFRLRKWCQRPATGRDQPQ